MRRGKKEGLGKKRGENEKGEEGKEDGGRTAGEEEGYSTLALQVLNGASLELWEILCTILHGLEVHGKNS